MKALTLISILFLSAAALGEQKEEFGPTIFIENISVSGNTRTTKKLITRALPFSVGQSMQAGDPKLTQAEQKLLALGFFHSVKLTLDKGTTIGRYIVHVIVEEKSTLILDKLLFGTNLQHPFWFGTELIDPNILGDGFIANAGFVFAKGEKIKNSTDQFGATVGLFIPRFGKSRFGGGLGLQYSSASEPYAKTKSRTDQETDYSSYYYTRLEMSPSLSFQARPLLQIQAGLRSSLLKGRVPASYLLDGITTEIPMVNGSSNVNSFWFSAEYDSRPNPLLPYEGSRLSLRAEAGTKKLGDYYFHRYDIAAERHWKIASKNHVLSLHANATYFKGNAPRFLRPHESDYNALAPPRTYGLVLSPVPPPSILRNQPMSAFGEVGGLLRAEYSFLLFRPKDQVWAGRLFIGAGVWSLANTSVWRNIDDSFSEIPIDMTFDAGLRVNTKVGVFEITIANAWGRLP